MELTPEQQLRIESLKEKWLKVSLSTEPSDRPRAEKAITELYRLSGKPAPVFEWYDSTKLAKLAVGTRPNNALYGQFEAYWLAYYEFVKDDIVTFSAEDSAFLDQFVEVGLSTAWYWSLEGLCIMAERPIEIHLDEDNNLHNTDGAAMLFRDGTGVYSIDGFDVPKWVVGKDGGITVEKIMAHDNIDVRRLAIERMGWTAFLENIGAESLSSDSFGDLYQVDAEWWGEERKLAVVTNGSPERDGTLRKYGLPGPNEMTSAGELVAWSYGLTLDEYSKLERRT